MKKEMTLSEMKKRVDAYFASRRRPLPDAAGEPVRSRTGEVQFEEKPPTVTGLALALGLPSREALFGIGDETKKALVCRALLQIEEAAEEKLFFKDSFAGTKLFLETNFPRWRENGDEAETDLGAFSDWAK